MARIRKELITATPGPGVMQSDGSGNITVSTALADGTTATTQSLGDVTTKVATNGFVNGFVAAALPVKQVFSIVATVGQTAFTLPSAPPVPTLVTLFRNGVQEQYTINFTVSGSTLTYLDVPAPLAAGEVISGFYNDTGISSFVTVTTKSASDIASLANASHIIEYVNSTSDYTFTLPQNSDVAFPIGTWMEIRKTGTGEITILKGAGTTFRGVLGDVSVKIDGSDGFSVFIEKTATNTWLLSGTVKAV